MDLLLVCWGIILPISPTSLSTILYVLCLSSNLLSITHITKALKCSITFFETHYVFENLLMGVKIGLGRERDGLYYLDMNWQDLDGQAKQVVGLPTFKEQIWLWHKRLGHSSFSYLHKLFLSLFSKVQVSNFHCDSCVLTKHHQTSFPSNFNKSLLPQLFIMMFIPPLSPFIKWFLLNLTLKYKFYDQMIERSTQ